jgi:hypothetical protein
MGKGSSFDIIIMSIALVLLAIGILVASVVMNAVQTTLGPTLNNAVATEALAQGVNAVNTFNYGFIVIFFGLAAGSLIFAYLIPTHPIFIILSIIMLMVSVVVLPILSNAFESFASDSSMAGAAASFPVMTFFMGNMTTILIALGFLTVIVMYTRWNSSGQE